MEGDNLVGQNLTSLGHIMLKLSLKTQKTKNG